MEHPVNFISGLENYKGHLVDAIINSQDHTFMTHEKEDFLNTIPDCVTYVKHCTVVAILKSDFLSYTKKAHIDSILLKDI